MLVIVPKLPKQWSDIDRAAIIALGMLIDQGDLSGRELARRSGITHTRLSRVFGMTDAAPLTLGEIYSLAEALGSPAEQIIRMSDEVLAITARLDGVPDVLRAHQPEGHTLDERTIEKMSDAVNDYVWSKLIGFTQLPETNSKSNRITKADSAATLKSLPD